MKLNLLSRKKEAQDTESFNWKSEKKLDYKPGQFFYFTFPKINGSDSRGPTRQFTLSSSPTEESIVTFTTRLRKGSGYKQFLKNLKKGDKASVEGPNGTFILDEAEPGPHVLLAGGIGITPFRSIIKYHIDKNIKKSFHLIYSNKTPEQIIFRNEFERWSKKYKNIKLDITITRPEEIKQEWSGLKGRIDDKLVSKLTKGYQNPTYWLVGPPLMVDTLEQTLGKLKISSSRIRTEKFTGY